MVRPGDDTSNPTLRFGYTNYGGTSAPYWVKQEQKESGSNYLESRTFYDGMGRVVQTQGEAATGSESIVVNTQYQPLGVLWASVPYTYTAALGGYRPGLDAASAGVSIRCVGPRDAGNGAGRDDGQELLPQPTDGGAG